MFSLRDVVLWFMMDNFTCSRNGALKTAFVPVSRAVAEVWSSFEETARPNCLILLALLVLCYMLAYRFYVFVIVSLLSVVLPVR